MAGSPYRPCNNNKLTTSQKWIGSVCDLHARAMLLMFDLAMAGCCHPLVRRMTQPPGHVIAVVPRAQLHDSLLVVDVLL